MISSNSSAQKGFTLVELIIVIAILGILAITALPRFIDISGDARLATLRAIKGSINSTVSLLRAEAMLQGVFSTTSPVDIDIDGNTLRVYNQGAPREIWTNRFENFIDIDAIHLQETRDPDQTLVCANAAFCIFDHIEMTNIIAGKPGFGFAVFPEGFSLSDDCYTYYAFHIDDSGLLQYIEAETIEDGC